MKRIFTAILLTMMLLSTSVDASSNDIKVTLDGDPLTFDVAPASIQGRTLVPLRTIFEALGAKIDWDDTTKTVTATKGEIKVVLTVGNKQGEINDKAIELEVPGTIINNRTLVPARFVAEALGAKVDWDGTTKTVIINSSEVVAKNQETNIVQNGVITFDDKSFGYVNTQIYADPGRYNGKKVIITGFVFRSSDFKENEFKVVRKESSGCTADAYVLGLVCRSENAVDYENDQWVTVKGTLVVTKYVDPKTNFIYEEIYLEPESIEKIKNRTDYYIY
ncbi:MAG: hypothetical protein K0R93_3411 [Anaerosolibacter sp.]|uniref:stalk domain-containing protein n=1 Tax=Anaerosolibacter sp. TaxID=1872527 RepID=UPI00261D6875|nr:stalk domain-containing protein [Anaerosolibacter sp.]MDF2548513.1 hypothetical protein [Anaerosolibacter sp.]